MGVNLNESDKISTFDNLFTTNHIRICKILLPHMDRNMQKVFSIYIKMSELSYTYNFIKQHPYPDIHTDSFSGTDNVRSADMQFSNVQSDNKQSDNEQYDNKETDRAKDLSVTDSIIKILEEIMPYSTEAEKEKISKISSLFGQMKNMQEMYEMYQTFSGMMQDSSVMSMMNGNSGDGKDSFDPQMLAEMLKMMQS